MIRDIVTAGWCLVLVNLLGATPSISADPAEAFQKNRESAAKDYERREGHPTAARISLRKTPPSKVASDPPKEGGWWSGLFGSDRKPLAAESQQIDVVVQLKSGEELVIDRILGDNVSAFPIITDSTGSVVGYFHSWVTQEDVWTSSRAAFALYLVGERALILRSGEVRCHKLANEGKPVLQFSNARWDEEVRELEFNLRASCYHVDLFGGRSHGILFNMSAGNTTYNSALKNAPWTETAQRLAVTFDAIGEVASFGRAKDDISKAKNAASNRKALQQCGDEAKKQQAFRLCVAAEPRLAFWRFGGEQVQYKFCNDGPDVAGKSYFIRACFDHYEGTRWVRFEIANEAAPAGIELIIECSCARLEVDRLSFNPELRTLSFNLNTDAKAIKFEGGEFQVPTIASRLVEGRAMMQVPIFSVRLNEQWQVVEMTAIGGEAPVGQAAGSP